MPPRRSARLVELANPQFQLPFPPDLVALLFSLLPLDTRLRVREVCRGWRLFLEDASLWTRVDLGVGCGLPRRYLGTHYLESVDRDASGTLYKDGARIFERHYPLALLRAACARAKGNLLSVDLSAVQELGRGREPSPPGTLTVSGEDVFVLQVLEALSAADKASLRDLSVSLRPRDHWTDYWHDSHPIYLSVEHVDRVCHALPLCWVRCGMECGAEEVLPLLRREPPYELLTIGKLHVMRSADGNQSILDLASALAGYNGMELIEIKDIPLTTRAVDALVDAAISTGIKDMSFDTCRLSQTALPALTRLLQSPGFEHLSVWNSGRALFEGPALPAFCEALRNSKNLRKLRLDGLNLWADVAVATQLIAALEGLPALKELLLQGNRTDGTPAMQRAAGECLARLIARSSRLQALGLFGSGLGEAGLAPIFEALRRSHTLAVLELYLEISAEFARDVVLPAVRANTSLRTLEGLRWVDAEDSENDDEEEELLPAMREVRDILEARRWADEEAA